jgi:5'-deoxynucleotidase YfbR-like HD superfamily hydrolase
MSFIETFTGVKFYPLDPRLDDIFIVDIAHALANQCRFAGHCREPYSVAEHCVRVSWLLGEQHWDTLTQLEGLMHDASEAYLVDLPTPLKQSTFGRAYREAEMDLMAFIRRRFGLRDFEATAVKEADQTLLATEVRDLMPHIPEHWGSLTRPLEEKIQPVSPREAKQMFLDRFNYLEAKRQA